MARKSRIGKINPRLPDIDGELINYATAVPRSQTGFYPLSVEDSRVFEDEIRSQRDNGEDGRNKYHKTKSV